MTYEDTKGMPHIVVIRSAERLEVREFTGSDARERAHAFAEKAAFSSDQIVATVAVRVRECGSFQALEDIAAVKHNDRETTNKKQCL